MKKKPMTDEEKTALAHALLKKARRLVPKRNLLREERSRLDADHQIREARQVQHQLVLLEQKMDWFLYRHVCLIGATLPIPEVRRLEQQLRDELEIHPHSWGL